jgi:hypothetical protein
VTAYKPERHRDAVPQQTSTLMYMMPNAAPFRGNASLCRSDAYVATRATGRTSMRGLAQPSTEMV